jgi:hypothetical protein
LFLFHTFRYTVLQQQEIITNCPKACGACPIFVFDGNGSVELFEKTLARTNSRKAAASSSM